jgi:hypothetical protein
MIRCRRTDGRLFARPARIGGWLVGGICALGMMAGYMIVAQIRCCSGSDAQGVGYAAMGLLSILVGAGVALAVALVIEYVHRRLERTRRGQQD